MNTDRIKGMVTVILPNYNHAPYLRQRIESILQQSYDHIELIILDDCSTDNSRKIIEEYKNHPKVKTVIYNTTNSGSTFIQWKKGIELAQGEYIWIAESDDYADTCFLEKTIRCLEQTQSSHCFSTSYYVDENSKITKEKEEVIDNGNTKSPFRNFVAEKMLYGCSIYNASMVVFRRTVVDGLDWDLITSFKLCGDWYFWNMTILNGQSCVSEVKQPLNYHRRHSSNTSSKKEVEGYSFLEGYTVSKETFKRLGLKDKKQFYIRWYNKWQVYKHEYSFSLQTNKNIFRMFVKQQPRVAYFEIKRLLYRILGLNAKIYIDPVKH